MYKNKTNKKSKYWFKLHKGISKFDPFYISPNIKVVKFIKTRDDYKETRPVWLEFSKIYASYENYIIFK